MPVFDTAAAIARNLDRQYGGKAIRLANKNRELVNQSLEQELEYYPEEFELEQRQVKAREDEYNLAFDKFQAETDETTRERTKDAAASAMVALEEGGDATAIFLAGLPKEEKPPEGFEFTKSFGKQFLASYKKHQEVAASNAKETTHQKVVADLVSSGAIDQETGDQLLLDIERKAGTVTGTTALDPSQTISKTGLSKITIDFRNKVTMATTGAQSATELVKISYQDPAALGKSGAIVTFGNELQKTAKNLMNLVSPAPLPASQTKKQEEGWQAFSWGAVDKEITKLGMAPVDAAKFKSGIYSIAFSAAVGEQGSRPSDKDIQQYIAIYGGNLTDARAFRGTIATAMTRQYNMLKNTADLNPEIGDSAASLAVFEKAYSEFQAALKGGSDIPTISNDAEYDALPSGTVFQGPDGKPRTKP